MIKLVLFDLDGTLFRGDEPIAGASDQLEALRRVDVHLRFVTNNSALSNEAIAAKLNRLGFQASPEECLGTGPFAASVCESRKYRSVFVVGEPGLSDCLSKFRADDAVDAVVVGVCRHFNYEICERAMMHVQRGAHFIATNRDPTYPLPGGKLQPGAGAMVAAIEACSETTPEVLGKPQPAMFRQIISQAQLRPDQCLVVGDRYSTDVAAGRAAGCHVVRVKSGVDETSESPASELDSVAGISLEYLQSL